MTPRERTGTRWIGEAPAKVNLFLRILDREPSGYHRIETLFQALELADGVTVEVLADHGEGEGESVAGGAPSIDLDLRGVGTAELGPPEANLAVRAARRFQEEVASRGRNPPALRIELEKRIPHGAGLGGGSSDAASVLLGANALSGNLLSPEDLLRIGGGLGSDVPFFLIGASAAFGTGRGEILRPLPSLPPREVLLLVPSEGISTGWAYQVLAESRGGSATVRSGVARDGSVRAENRVDRAVSWETLVAMAFNDFEEVLFPLRPDLERWKELLQRHGASPALLSGSGSVLFGVFSDSGALGEAQREAEATGLRTLHTRTRS
jgi:4-diphosphocytidyl-2-C-methyl-D-erythritol kinase